MRRRERGVALLEFALVAPLLFGLLAAVVDFGFAWRTAQEVSSIVRSGVRVEASLGDDRTAEYEALAAMNAGIANVGAANILRVIVYESSTANGAMPASCDLQPLSTGRGVSGTCNVYGPAQLGSLAANISRFSGSTTECDSTDWDRWYCPIGREADQSDGAEYVGVFVEYRINWVVGVLPGGGRNAVDRAVMRIEPGL